MYAEKLKILEDRNLLRQLQDRESSQGSRTVIEGTSYLNFSSNDYLGLANHPSLTGSVRKTLDVYGFGAGASRLLGGGSVLHRNLEEGLARFKGTEKSLVFNSGYAANTGAIPALSDKDTTLFSDEFNHASIIDGCRLSGSKTLVYRHRDMDHLEELMRTDNSEKKIVVSDTVFSMDGDIAPLKELSGICARYSSILYLDEAHATGVIGGGRGGLTHFALRTEPWILQMGTFSKAFGSFGAFVAGASDIVQWLSNSARSLIYSTALPPCVIAASIAALELVENDPLRIRRLWANRERLASALRGIGFDIMGSETPIIPIRTGTVEDTLRMSAHLLEKGFFVPAIRPPTVKESRIRISVTAMHTDEDIESLVHTLERS